MNILHLSDLHFGEKSDEKSTVMHAYTGQDGKTDPESLAKILIHKYSEECLDFLVVSGDIGWSGADTDFDYARTFFNKLLKAWTRTQLIIVPGNHDVDLQKKDDDRRQHQYVQLMENILRDNGLDFEEIYPFYKNERNREDIVSILYNEDKKVLFVGANSSYLINGLESSTQISKRSLDKISNYIKEKKIGDDTLKIFVLHHHLFPFDYKKIASISIDDREQLDTTVISNSAYVQTWLADNNFKMVLHGHKHASHGRKDTLWKGTGEANKFEISVVAAGSTGVGATHRTGNLSFNSINIKTYAGPHWDVNVKVNEIDQSRSYGHSISETYNYFFSVGKESNEIPVSFFRSDSMSDCYSQFITNAEKHNGMIYGFFSEVNAGEYSHPDRVLIGPGNVKKEIFKADIEKSFKALHPEYDASDKWINKTKLEETLDTLSHRFQFSHGVRVFKKRNNKISPIDKAIKELKHHATSKSYIALSDPNIDVGLKDNQPLPGLTGFQFVHGTSDQRVGGVTPINLYVTFRKLELSFWWLVNMYESIEILNYVVNMCNDDGVKYSSGKILFYSPMAEIKDDPNPSFITRIDSISHEEIVSLAQGNNLHEIISVLEEKIEHTNENNLDYYGLDNLIKTMNTIKIIKKEHVIYDKMSGHINSAINNIKKAVKESTEESRKALVKSIKESLQSAIYSIEDLKI